MNSKSYARRSVFRYAELAAKLLLCEATNKDYKKTINMHVEWKYKEVVGMQARGLLLTRRSKKRCAEQGASTLIDFRNNLNLMLYNDAVSTTINILNNPNNNRRGGIKFLFISCSFSKDRTDVRIKEDIGTAFQPDTVINGILFSSYKNCTFALQPKKEIY